MLVVESRTLRLLGGGVDDGETDGDAARAGPSAPGADRGRGGAIGGRIPDAAAVAEGAGVDPDPDRRVAGRAVGQRRADGESQRPDAVDASELR